jgi:hypothetical protein
VIPGTIAVYLAVGPVDLRGAFDRLAAITRQALCLDPASGALFLCTRSRPCGRKRVMRIGKCHM